MPALVGRLATMKEGAAERRTRRSERPSAGQSVYNAPLPATSFIGREAEVAACAEALDSGRLVTLTGSGGCGKTRLALAVSQDRAADYADGIWWVDLVQVAEPSSVAAAVGRELGLWLETEADPAGSLAAFLRDREAVVVLDNCEHLLVACRELVSRLLAEPGSSRLLATSREPIAIAGEIAQRVPPMAVADNPTEVAESEAGRLFAARAVAVRPNFQISADNAAAVLSICRRLDGIPLALELAAARTRLLTAARIAAGLEEDFRLLGSSEVHLPRQRTIEASIAWSHALCTEAEQVLFRRLAAFVGGFTLDAAEEVADSPPLDRYGILDLLDRLIDRSLVAVDDARPDRRFRLLETVRAFALERLQESGEADLVRDRHLEYFLGLAEAGEAAIPRPGGLAWLTRLEDDHANLSAALEHADRRSDPEPLLRLSTALALFWEMRGRFRDGSSWLDRALARSVEDSSVLRVRALWARAHLAIYAADFTTALSIAPDALKVADARGDAKAAGRLRNTLGFALCYTDPQAALRILEESVELGLRADDDWAVADSTKFMTAAHLIAGDVERCEAAVVHLRDVATRLGNAFFMGWCDGASGYCQLLRGRLVDAVDSFERSMSLAAEVGDPATLGVVQAWRAYALAKLGRCAESRQEAMDFLTRTVHQGGGVGTPFAHIALGVVALAEGDAEPAAATLGEVATWARTAGDTMSVLWAVPLLGQALVAAGRLDEAAAELEDAIRRAGPPIDNPWSSAQAQFGQGLLAIACGDTGEAENLLHQALAIQAGRGFVADGLETLLVLGALAARAESWLESARLLGAVSASSGALGLALPAHLRALRSEAEEACRAHLADPAYDAAATEGAQLGFDEAVAYAARARGTRSRPVHGWESLTPTEQRVVDALTQGLSNPEIGARLFMSRATVKTHLAHIFGKLDVSSRTELATAAARRVGPVRSGLNSTQSRR